MKNTLLYKMKFINTQNKEYYENDVKDYSSTERYKNMIKRK